MSGLQIQIFGAQNGNADAGGVIALHPEYSLKSIYNLPKCYHCYLLN